MVGRLSKVFSFLVVIWTAKDARCQLEADPVKLTVYLESLCPDSIDFVVDQLGPTWKNLQEIVAVDFNAYGFVTETPAGEGYEFSCQHGSNECAGNMVIECAKKYIGDVRTFVDFSICMMSTPSPPQGGEECAIIVGEPWEPIDSCATSVEGQQLLHEAGIRQNSMDPVPNWMPWVVVNDEFSQDLLDEAQSDLTGLVCRIYEGIPPPACQ